MKTDNTESAVMLAKLRARATELRALLIRKRSRVQIQSGLECFDEDTDLDASGTSSRISVSMEDVNFFHQCSDIEVPSHADLAVEDTLPEDWSSLGANAEGSLDVSEMSEFEGLIEGVIFRMRTLREDRALVFVFAWWRSYTRSRHTKKKTCEMVISVSRWNVLQSNFVAMHAKTHGERSKKERLAMTYRQRRLMYSADRKSVV